MAPLAFQSLQSYHVHRFEQSRVLSQSLKTDVIENLREVIKNQGTEYKRLLIDGKKLEKDLKNNMDQVEKVRVFIWKKVVDK